MQRKSKISIIGAVVAVPLLIGLFYALNTGVNIVTSGSELVPFETNRAVTYADMIVIGTVKNVETRFVDESYVFTDSLTGESHNVAEMRPYKFVTISEEKYLLDRSETYPQEVTFRDYASGCTTVDSKPSCIYTEGEVSYNQGERILVFVENVDGNKQVNGQVGKFVIKNGIMESEHDKQTGKAPKNATEFETKIKDIIEKQKAKKP